MFREKTWEEMHTERLTKHTVVGMKTLWKSAHLDCVFDSCSGKQKQ